MTSRRTALGMLMSAMSGAVLASACIEEDLPTSARVVVEAEPQQPLQLIVSSSFLIRQAEGSEDRDAEPLEADTIFVSTAFDRTFDITQFARVYVRVTNLSATPETATLRVYVDGDQKFNEGRVLEEGDFLRFLFTSTAAY